MQTKEIIEMEVEMMQVYKQKITHARTMPLLSLERKKLMDEAELGVRQFKTKLYKYLTTVIDERLDKVQTDFETVGNA